MIPKSCAHVKRDLEKGRCACCHSNETVTSLFYKISGEGKVNGVPLVIPRSNNKGDNHTLSRSHKLRKGKEPEGMFIRVSQSPPKRVLSNSVGVDQTGDGSGEGGDKICARHERENQEMHAAPLAKYKEGKCMCCYIAKTHSPDFYTVTNGIVDLYNTPLFLPWLTPYSTGTICAKHFARNTELNTLLSRSQDVRLEIGACMLPKKDRGEDAYFVSSDGRAVGIADGVGGWAQYGIDPLEFPEMLMQQAHSIISSTGKVDVLDILNEAYDATQCVTGSSTAILAILDSKDTLRTLSIGDSGFRVIRDSNVVYASKEQQHAPNKPYQLGTECEDLPEHGIMENMKLRVGDYIVFGTDGLFDNLFDREIIDVIEGSTLTDMNQVALDISLKAQNVSNDKQALTPYAMWVRSLGNPEWAEFLGGKKDDITTIFVKVVQNTNKLTSSTSTITQKYPFDSEQVLVGKPSMIPNCTEKQYFEYMTAMREFEVFENLHKRRSNVQLTVLPYYIL